MFRLIQLLVPIDYSHIQVTIDGNVYGPAKAPLELAAGTSKTFSLKVIPAENQIGSVTLTVKIVDGTGTDQMTAEKTFNLTVKNEPPKIEGLPTQLFTSEDIAVTGRFKVSDTEGGMMSFDNYIGKYNSYSQ